MHRRLQTREEIVNKAKEIAEALYDHITEKHGREPTVSVIIANLLLTSWMLKRLTPNLTEGEKQLINEVLLAIYRWGQDEESQEAN